MKTKLEELYEKMVDEAPFIFPESNREYVFELARLYAEECCIETLKVASEKACIEPKGMMTRVDKESITNPENIVLL